MKKNGLALAVASGLLAVGGVADAVYINPDGTGQVLIYPYYTVQENNNTSLSIVNTTGIGKAVKVRFLEGKNSREVLDFNLYLSPYDVWTGTLFIPSAGQFNAGNASLVTRDRSCTAPDIARGGFGIGQLIGTAGQDVCDADLGQTADGAYYAGLRPFVYLPDSATPASDRSCRSNLERLKEGYFEALLMGDIDPTSPTHGWALHNASGEPGNCQAIAANWANLSYATGPRVGDIIANAGAGGLFGNALIVNPPRGTIVGYAADALDGWRYSTFHTEPGDLNPNVGSVEDNPADPGYDADFATAQLFVNGSFITASYDGFGQGSVDAGRRDAVSALFASRRVTNEYHLLNESHVQAQSEWVVTFPTKRFYVDNDPLPSYLGAGVIAPNAPYEPFTADFDNGACEIIGVNVFDREERTPQTPGVCDQFPPPPQCSLSPIRPRPEQPTSALCWEAQVVSFNQPAAVQAGGKTSILGASYAENITTPYQSGWANINFANPANALRPSAEGNILRGLPVTGFFVSNIDNGVSNAGVLANYSSLFHHRSQRECITEGGDACS